MAHESPKSDQAHSAEPSASARRIRNVALVGHRGERQDLVNEALLFEAGAINRLRLGGRRIDGLRLRRPTRRRAGCRSPRASPRFGWQDRKINLIDTPGEPSFVADALAALRVVEGAVFVINGVMGVEVVPTASGSARPTSAWRASCS